MAIQYNMDAEGDILRVKVWGEDDDLEDVLSYNQDVAQFAHQKSIRRILSDERELTYAISEIDTFELGEALAELARGLEKLALVVSRDNYEDARFWETTVRNRGIPARVFLDMEKAEKWIVAGR